MKHFMFLMLLFASAIVGLSLIYTLNVFLIIHVVFKFADPG